MASPTAFAGLPASTAGTLSIAELRSAAARDPKAAIRETAKQFEALFMQQLMKSMREATMASGMLDNEGTKLGTEMLDSQYALKMTGLPGGLTDAIARQLERQMGAGSTAAPAASAAGGVPLAPTLATATPLSRKQVDFVQQHGVAARAAEAQSGIPAAFMIGQAAHESGWGRQEIRNADGSSAKNLFGIKAGGGWNGPVAEITTTEYVDGVARKVTAKFRAYASYEESFRDYARMLKDSPRYAAVAARAAQGVASAASAAGFAQGLQRAGYATDPAYADKLARVINTAMRVQRATA
jgi:flagellar protein FlgJ